tara:strand:- start:145 stop:717 length:573 start_codon:yes stop_codon:yes gene_type:complete
VGTVSHPSNNAFTATNGTLTGNLNVTGTTTLSTKLATSNLGAGAVLQVVQGGRTTRVTHNSQTYGDIGVTATITPSSTSSKILIQLTGTLGNSNASNLSFIRLFRGSTQIGSGTGGDTSDYNSFMSMLQDTTTYSYSGISGSFLDSPSTTSATTYKLQCAAYNGTAVMGGRPDNTNVATPTLLTLMEIAG